MASKNTSTTVCERESSTRAEVIRLHLSTRQKSKYVYPENKPLMLNILSSEAFVSKKSLDYVDGNFISSAKKKSVSSFSGGFLILDKRKKICKEKMTKNN